MIYCSIQFIRTISVPKLFPYVNHFLNNSYATKKAGRATSLLLHLVIVDDFFAEYIDILGYLLV